MGPAAATVPEIAVAVATGGAASTVAEAAPASPRMGLSSPAIVPDEVDGADHDDPIIVSENPQDVRLYGDRIMAYLHDLEVRDPRDGRRLCAVAASWSLSRHAARANSYSRPWLPCAPSRLVTGADPTASTEQLHGPPARH